ncbi:MAG: hypothetical protein CMF50_09820 [Legionellales bacterium]|nr:hypothetical protein [Legionellales bacterium]|tara:strand:- start:2839 stop:4845 length:2007 start_codon:yes stop_codon:yes gene_type:complete
MKKLLKITGFTLLGGVLLLFVGVCLFITFFDLNNFKPQIEQRVSDTLGREFVIHGDVKIDYSLRPTVALNNVTVANEQGAKAEYFFKAKQVEVGLSARQLLKKTIDIETFRLIGAQINLEKNKQGKVNWQFLTALQTKLEQNDEPIKKLPIEKVRVDDFTLNYFNGVTNQSQEFLLEALGIDFHAFPTMAIYARGNYMRHDFHLQGKLHGVIDDEDNKLEIDVKTNIGKTNLSLFGSIHLPPTTPWLDAKLAINSDDTRDLAKLLDIQATTVKTLALNSQVIADDKGFHFNETNATIGQTTFVGSLTLAAEASKTWLNADMHVKGPSTDDIRRLFSLPIGKVSPMDLQVKVKADKTNFHFQTLKGKIGSTQISLTGLIKPYAKSNWMDVSASARGSSVRNINQLLDITLPIIGAINMRGKIKASGDVYNFTSLSGNIAGSHINGSATVDDSKRATGLKLKISLRNSNAGKFIRDLGISNAFRGGSLRAYIDVMTQLSEAKNVMKNATGRAEISLLNTQYYRTGGSQDGAKFRESLSGKSTTTVPINCFIGSFTLKNGMAQVKTFVFDSPQATVKGSGTINLSNESINLDLSPYFKSVGPGTLIRNAKMTGTLSQPRVSLTVTAGTFIKTAIGVATGGVGLVGIIGAETLANIGATNNACAKALKVQGR